MGMPVAVSLSRTSSINRKRVFAHLYYFDANHEQTLSHRTTQMAGLVSESTDASRTTDTEGSDTECHSTSVTVRHLLPADEADDDLADFNFGDTPSAGAPVAGQDESQLTCTLPDAHSHTQP